MTYWVGQVDRALLLFDKAAQIPGCPHVFLWSSLTKRMEKYVATTLRPLIKQAEDSAESQVLTNDYEKWKREFLAQWISEQRDYYSSRGRQEAIQRRESEDRKRAQRLEEQRRGRGDMARAYSQAMPDDRQTGFDAENLRSLGLRRPPRFRSVQCFACRAPLVSSSCLECIDCGWLVCQCRSCGCRFIPD